MAYHACKSDGRYHRLTGATIPPRRLFMVPLIAAAVLGVSRPVANADFGRPGLEVWCAEAAKRGEFCVLDTDPFSFVYNLPELGGLFLFINRIPGGPFGHFVLGTDGAGLTGDVFSQEDPTVQFSGALDFSGRKPADPATVDIGLKDICCGALCISLWTQFTGISGELVGLPGSQFAGARYAITKRSGSCSNDSSISCTVATQEADCGVGNTCNLVIGADAQYGFSASTRDVFLGLAAKFDFELVNPSEHPDLPVGPFAGNVAFYTKISGLDLERDPVVLGQCFPPAVPDLTGTWTGTIDCVGFDAEAGPHATPVENFFSAATLEIGRSTNELDLGDQYSVRLTRETGNAQSFCAYAPSNPGSTTGGQGVLVEPHRQQTRVYFRFEGETLKARELVADGLHGTQLCKWSFTRANTTPPVVSDACSPFSCVTANLCDDNALCGQGPDCQGASETCTCVDGFVGDGDTCTPAP